MEHQLHPFGAPEFIPGIQWVTQSQLYVYVLQIVVCPFVLFLLAIVLSVLLRYTGSDYPFGIFKPLLCIDNFCCTKNKYILYKTLHQSSALDTTTLLTHLDVRVGMLLTCGNQLHDRIISLRGRLQAHKASSIPLLRMPVQCQES